MAVSPSAAVAVAEPISLMAVAEPISAVAVAVAVAEPVAAVHVPAVPVPVVPISEPITQTRVVETPVPLTVPEPSPTRSLAPLEAASSPQPASSPVKAPVAAAEVIPEITAGALALATEPAASLDLDLIRDTVCTALEAQGHSTASVLLSAGQWREKGDGIEVEVGIKKTMLGLTMNADAEKICKGALRAIGVNQKLSFIPGEASASGPRLASKLAVAASGSIQSIALENPLVRQAQELFRAEVRSVLDLREGK